jgi:hypothetical protein
LAPNLHARAFLHLLDPVNRPVADEREAEAEEFARLILAAATRQQQRSPRRRRRSPVDDRTAATLTKLASAFDQP